MTDFQSWGRVPRLQQNVRSLSWLDEAVVKELSVNNDHMLAVGMGRSYGDSCLTAKNGLILDLLSHNRIIFFDETSGIIRCQSGVTFDEILNLIVPKKWFLPVSPGTKYITVGGAVANDVHGKNHHLRGTFGHWVTQLRLVKSSGQAIECSPDSNAELFKATIGGLGLTGIIDWVEFKLRPIENSYIDAEIIPFKNLEGYFLLSAQSKNYEYVVSWVDVLGRDKNLGRGLFIRGNPHKGAKNFGLHKQKLNIPFDFPEFAVSKWTSKIFNFVYYHQTFLKNKKIIQHYDPFFYPLDSIRNWNRVYGKRGFYQYQFVVPTAVAPKTVAAALDLIAQSGQPSPLSVLKNFGEKPSLGYLSFPREGTTLAIDVPNSGAASTDLFKRLDDVVMNSGGAVYPAKDARMPEAIFKQSFPHWQQFLNYKDPKLSSHFFKRVFGEVSL
jgi:FAD/FMN-containing dehydrogenase